MTSVCISRNKGMQTVLFVCLVRFTYRCAWQMQSSNTGSSVGPVCDMSVMTDDTPNVLGLLLVDIGLLALLFLGLRRWKGLQGVGIWQLIRDQVRFGYGM